MKYLGFLILFSVLVISCGGKQEVSPSNHEDHMHGAAVPKAVESERLIYYSCPMESHKHIHSGEPGTCTECGMKLVAGVITSEEKMQFWGCPMEIHSHIRLDEPGSCELCKMKLQPMRLVTAESDSTKM
jgi:hypothetical protein